MKLGDLIHRDAPVEALAESADTTKGLTFRLNQQLEESERELRGLYSYLEKDLDNYTSKLVAVVNSPDAYFRASTVYNKEWFCSLPYSLDAKIKIAKLLIDAVSQYNPSYCSSLWKSIASRDYTTLQSIRYYEVGGPGNEI